MSSVNYYGALMNREPASGNFLDAYVGAGVGFWCGVFKSFSSYTGNCMQIKRSSDGTTLDVGFIGNYVDTASIATFCSGTIGTIERWYNQFPNLPSGFPTYISQGASNTVQVYNSGLLVDGNGILMPNAASPATFDANNGSSTLNQQKALMMANFDADGSGTVVYSQFAGAASNVFYNYIASNQFNYQIVGNVGTSFNIFQASPNTLSGGPQLLTYVEDQTFRALRENNTQVQSNSTSITYSTQNMTDFRLVLRTSDKCNMWCIWLEDQSANVSAIENIVNNDYQIY